MDASFGYSFPAIRGVQAGREYYVSMCPIRLIPQIFMFDGEELPPEMRAQRILNKTRIPEMVKYMLNTPSDYTFSALTASIDGETKFEPFIDEGDLNKLGALKISMGAKFIINDGQHRRAAIEMAIREKPEIANETIAVVFFLDIGLKRSQQMFSDLNRYTVRPSRSLNVLYDHRDEYAILTKELVFTSNVFKNIVEMEKSTLAPRSGKLFTLSAIYHANKSLFASTKEKKENRIKLAREFWKYLDMQIPEWKMVRERKMLASEVRQGYIHTHAVTLHALGRVGKVLLTTPKPQWKKQLNRLKSIDWSRRCPVWEGRAIIGGTVSKSMNNITLTNNIIKSHLNLKLTPDEQRVENAYKHGKI
ncbi:MAG: DNA sulfur modification protein DndB [Victivallaceae bacterium]|nr:DNA sulfur modification protein DndB [Victivallaceae bacterium]